MYPRPDGTVYVCGESDDSAVPDDPLSITPRADAMTALKVRVLSHKNGHRMELKALDGGADTW